MRRHVISWVFIPNDAKRLFINSEPALSTTNSARKSINSRKETLSSHFAPIMTKKQLEDLYDQVVRFALSTNFSFNALEDKELSKLFKKCN